MNSLHTSCSSQLTRAHSAHTYTLGTDWGSMSTLLPHNTVSSLHPQKKIILFSQMCVSHWLLSLSFSHTNTHCTSVLLSAGTNLQVWCHECCNCECEMLFLYCLGYQVCTLYTTIFACVSEFHNKVTHLMCPFYTVWTYNVSYTVGLECTSGGFIMVYDQYAWRV